MQIDWVKLKEPFDPKEVEWRIAQVGEKRDGSIWAKVLAYITNRAIMNRLDESVGPSCWKNEYKPGPCGGVICGISIRIDTGHGDGEWVTKWDGADNTDIESTKGGLSDSMKRAAVQWGIGRYLYDLEEGWAQIVGQDFKGSRYANSKAKVNGQDKWLSFNWVPPELPDWAKPSTQPKPQATQAKTEPHKKPIGDSVQMSREQVEFNSWIAPYVSAGKIEPDTVRSIVKSCNGNYRAAHEKCVDAMQPRNEGIEVV